MASSKIARREIAWETAKVEDGVLTVELTGTASKRWGEDFAAVLAMLGSSHAGWQETALRKSAIEVHGVRAGSEEELRHFLESVVLQVNVDLDLEAEEQAEPSPQKRQESADQAADRKMSDAFQAFAAADEGARAE